MEESYIYFEYTKAFMVIKNNKLSEQEINVFTQHLFGQGH